MEVPTYMLSPPYREASHVLNLSNARAMYARGVILAVRPAATLGTDALSSYITALQRRRPHITIAVWLDLTEDEMTPRLIATASRHAVRGFITSSVPSPDQLRRSITDPTSLADDIAYRLRTFGCEVNHAIADLISAACAHAVECRNVRQVADAAELKYDSLLRALRLGQLGTPARLYQVFRLLLIAVRLQRDPLARISNVSTHYHFYDEAALRARFREVFGVSPSVVRSWIGWEYLLYIGMRRAGIWPRLQAWVR